MKDTLTHRQLQSLMRVSNVLNSSLDIDTIMDSIMNQTISVVDAADGGSVWLYDPEEDCLVAQRARGSFYPHIFNQIRLKPGESMTGKAFAAKKCIIYPNATEVEKGLSNISPKNLGYLEASVPNFPFTSVMCTPILLNGESVGVITLDSFRSSLTFTKEDVKLVKAISHQAAVAIEKANLYRDKEKTVAKLQRLNHMITQQNHLLSRTVEIHRTLADLVLHGEGLHSIIKYIHETIGQHVLLFDDIGEVIGTACDFPLAHGPFQQIREEVTPILKMKNRSVKEVALDGKSHQLILLPIGSKPLLGVLVILSEEKIGEVDIAALEHACTVISLERVKEQAIFETQQRLQGEFIHTLYSGTFDETLIQKAKYLNFDPTGKYIAVIINLENLRDRETNQMEGITRHLIKMTGKVFLDSRGKGMVVRDQDQIIVLLSFGTKTSSTWIMNQVKESISLFQQEIHRRDWDTEVSIGIGRVKSGLFYVHKSLQEATKCLQFIRSYKFEDRVLSYTDLGVQRLILQNSEEELMDFIQEALGPLLSYENTRKGGELLHTLFVFLENNQNAKNAAETLHIHTNTLIYRLKRIEEILSIDLADSKQFLNVHLAISVYQYIKDHGEGGKKVRVR